MGGAAAWARVDVTHLLLTNDYPPKVGGIQSYLWELWRRLPQDDFAVFTSPHANAADFDRAQQHRIVRHDRFWLPPTRRVAARARAVAHDIDADLVVIDPAFPLAALASQLERPYAVVLHGAEVSVPARLAGTSRVLRNIVTNAALVISASRFAEREARRVVANDTFPPTVYVPPGVDTKRFVPMAKPERDAQRRAFGLPVDVPLLVGVSRLVPRKGFDTLIKASAILRHRHPALEVVIAGIGRDESRLRRLIGATGAPVRMLGYVPDDDLPGLYACADASVMLCRKRWGGLEQEGFGIVFVEAAAAGCPQIAGDSGGAADAVDHEQTGLVVARAKNVDDVAAAIDRVLTNHDWSDQLRVASRQHATSNFAYDVLAPRLHGAITACIDSQPRPSL